MKSRTFREWVKDGYLIIKGSKAVSFNEKDEALFAENQVRKKTIINYEYEGVDYSKDPEFWAKASPNQMYRHMIRFPDKYKSMSENAGAILAKNLY